MDKLHNIEIEQHLLSILLADNKSFELLPEYFSEEHFYHPTHQTLFGMIRILIQRGDVANPLTLGVHIPAQHEEARKYIQSINQILSSVRSTRTYADQIYDFFLERKLCTLGQDIITQSFERTIDSLKPKERIEHIEKQLFDISSHVTERSFESFGQSLDHAISSAEKAYKRDGRIVGCTTGFVDIDRLLGGMHPSDLLILAARPSMGKTALATNIAFNTALAKMNGNDSGASVAFFSLEMSSEQIAMRILGQESGISSDKIRRGAIDVDSFPKFLDISRNLARLPLFIDDTPALSIENLLQRSRRIKKREDIGLIVIDYLQLMSGSTENRVQEIANITRGLKKLAKELNIPVLALSQLSRAVEQREDKRPQLADLRESGSIEQDADVVMFIYRAEYYEARKKPASGTSDMAAWQTSMASVHNKADLIIAKQRHGPIDTIPLHYDGPRTKFSNFVLI